MGKKIFFLLITVGIIMASIWVPEKLAKYHDQVTLNQIHVEPGTLAEEGYRYILNSNEKLYILSEALSSQKILDNQPNGLSRNQVLETDYNQIPGNYALVVNHRKSDEEEIKGEEVYSICNQELSRLIDFGILPAGMADVEAGAYDTVLYSAIDVLEPRNHVSVWKISLSNIQKNVRKQNRLIDAYIDADSGKIYEFYVRTEYQWEDIDSDEIITVWRDYMGLSTPFAYETANPLLETTPHYKKYLFAGEGDRQTIVTIGFYEGINELFLRVSR